MRIGRTIIDIESLSIEDMRTIEREIHDLRKRREKAENLKGQLLDLINEANAAGFDFIDKDFGNVIRPQDIEIYENP